MWRELKASIFARSTGAHFVKDLGFPLITCMPDPTPILSDISDMHAHDLSSFDEPLASTMSGKMVYDRSAEGAACSILCDEQGWRDPDQGDLKCWGDGSEGEGPMGGGGHEREHAMGGAWGRRGTGTARHRV